MYYYGSGGELLSGGGDYLEGLDKVQVEPQSQPPKPSCCARRGAPCRCGGKQTGNRVEDLGI